MGKHDEGGQGTEENVKVLSCGAKQLKRFDNGDVG